MTENERIERRLRKAGLLVGAGLVVELATLFSSSPAAFLAFLLIGGTLIAGGTLFYLYGLVAR